MLSRPDFDSPASPSEHHGGAARAATVGVEAGVETGIGAGVASGAADAACSVSELNRRARSLLEGAIGRVRVRGEISGFTRATSGHVYFSLKDESAQVRCALWRSKAGALTFEPKNGDAIEVRASVTLFEARGEFQLSVESMRRAGAGALYELFLRLKEKLANDGLFAAQRKRAIPAMPRGIGIVTSLQAAARHDVLTTRARRAPMIPVIVIPAPVQGEGAAALIASAIETAGRYAHGSTPIDVLIVCRGGGSMEDLWAFNEEVVARAIAACPVAVVSGVGHETDFTIADWVADLRAPTPTAAAELASPNRVDMHARLASAVGSLEHATARHLADAQQRLDWLARALMPPSARMAMQRQRVMHLGARLRAETGSTLAGYAARCVQAMGRLRAPRPVRQQLQLTHARKRLTGAALGGMASQEAHLERLSDALHMLDPQRVLARGFAIVSDAQGQVVRDFAMVAVGDMLDLRFARGGVRAVVDRMPDRQDSRD